MSVIRPVLRPVIQPALPTLADVGLPWESGFGGDSAPASLSLLTGGTFTRSTEGSVLTAAPTDGSTAFLVWLAANTRRIGYLGVLIEGSRTNRMIQSRTPANIAWSSGTAALTSAANAGVDGAALAFRELAGLSMVSQFQTALVGTGQECASVWVRAVSGAANHQIVGFDAGPSNIRANAKAVTTTYARNDVTHTVGTSIGIIPLDSRDWSANGGQAANTQDCYLDLAQSEQGYFPTSAIRTTAAAATRGADILTFASGQYFAALLSAGGAFTFAPLMTSAELVLQNIDMRLLQVGANDYVRLRNNAGTAVLDLVCGGVVKGTLSPTWSRDQVLSIRFNPAAGTITLAGATTGNGANGGSGAAWAAASTLYVGADNAGANNAFGHFSPSISA